MSHDNFFKNASGYSYRSLINITTCFNASISFQKIFHDFHQRKVDNNELPVEESCGGFFHDESRHDFVTGQENFGLAHFQTWNEKKKR